jgi:2-aminoadipate transaminase
MRLNFSASQPEEIREGIRRIGQVVWEQVALYETITGESPVLGPQSSDLEPETAEMESSGGEVLPLPRREARGGEAGH